MDKEIMKMAEQLKALSNVAVLQYTNIVNDILDEKITDEQEREFYLKMTRKYGWSKDDLYIILQ